MNTQTKPQTAGERLLEAAKRAAAAHKFDGSWRHPLIDAIAAYESQPDGLREALDCLEALVYIPTNTTATSVDQAQMDARLHAHAVLKKHGRAK